MAAVTGPPEEGISCTQSHVSTSGPNVFSLGCTARYANLSCSGRPLAVSTNRCLNEYEIEAYWGEKMDGHPLPAGACAPAKKLARLSCEKLCQSRGMDYGRCFSRRVACFGNWEMVGYCRCAAEAADLDELALHGG